MKIIRSPRAMQAQAMAWQRAGRSIGFVPTMGALHEGHLSLIRRARRENKRVVVSIFVNPSQFGPREDLKKYPRPFARDARLCRSAGVDAIFHPAPQGMYPQGFQTWVAVDQLAQPLEGRFRPGHFRGVATVVAQLFNITQPTKAYFGQKDFQQLRVIQRMANDLHMPFRIVPCPTARAADGLALSSRNVYLKSAERRAAAGISAALRSVGKLIKSGKLAVPRSARVLQAALRKIPGARLQYAAAVNPRTLAPVVSRDREILLAAAVYLGRTRLIDNWLVKK